MADMKHMDEPEKLNTASGNSSDQHHDASKAARQDSETTVARNSQDLEKLDSSDLQQEDEKVPDKWTFSRLVAFISLCLLYSGSQMILYFTAGALTYIQVSIGTEIPNWLLTANTLASCAILPFVGYITDLLGRRWVCLVGSVLIVVSTAVMGNTKSLASSLVAQALGGAGAGITELTALAGVAEITPVKWRGVSLAILTAFIAPYLPYLIYINELQESSTWRWIFLIAGVWNLAGGIGIYFCYKPPPRNYTDGLSRIEIAKRVDYVGGILSICGVTLLLVGLQSGGYQYPWRSAKVLAPLLIGAALIVLFVLWEWWGPKNPMVPKDIFKGQRVVALAFTLSFIGGLYFYAVNGFFPIMLQKIWMASPLKTGVRALGYPIAIVGAAIIVSVLISYSRGHVRELFGVGAAIMTAFTGALVVSSPTDPVTGIALLTCASFGIGWVMIPAMTIALYACPDRYIGTTSALVLSTRFLGGSVGTAIFYNIFNTKQQKLSAEYVMAAVSPLGFPMDALPQLLKAFQTPEEPQSAAMMVVSKVIPDQQKAMQIVMAAGQSGVLALTKSLSYVWYATIPFGVCAIVAALLLPNIKKYMTSRVAVNMG